MKIAISGASGLIGTALAESLERDGHVVQRLVRGRASSEHDVEWSVADQRIDAEKLTDTDVVVHLAGEPVIGARWTEEKKRRVLRSRVDGTSLIATTLASLPDGPMTLISASAVGYYGDTREWVDEDSPRGDGFLAEVCEAWERAADPARDAGIRVVHPRTGLVLTPDGGVLGKMLPAFKLGVGGPLGDGTQYFPWITIRDEIAAIRFAIDEPSVEGPVNLVAPSPVTNEVFSDALADVLSRPSFFRVPKFAIKTALGDMGKETLLAGQRVRPARLIEAGFAFQDPELEEALAELL